MIWHYLIGKEDSFPSLPPWNHPSSDCTRWQRRCIQSPGSCTSAHKCWTGKPSPAILLSIPSSPLSSTCFSTVLFLLDLQSFIWRQEGKAREKNFCGYRNKIQTKRMQTKRQLTLQSLSLTTPKPSRGPHSGSSEYLWLTTDFYTFLKLPILALQPLVPPQQHQPHSSRHKASRSAITNLTPHQMPP